MKHLFLTSKFHYVASSLASKLTEEQKKRVAFITTPFKYRHFEESELVWHYNNLEAMQLSGFSYNFYDIIGKTHSDLERDLAKYATIYVEGGSPFFLIQEANKNNFSQYLKHRLETGIIYISESAGSVCAGIDIAANSRPGKSLKDYSLPNSSGFGFTNFAILPHWGQAEKYKDYIGSKIPNSYHENYSYILLNNNQYIEVMGDTFQIHTVSA